MLLFGKVSGNLPDCEKLHSKSNEESISHNLSDSQHHTDTIHRRDRKTHKVLSRSFSPKSHVAAMLYCQVSKTESLNSICDVARANDALWRSMGVTPPMRNTPPNANAQRPSGMAKDLYWKTFSHLLAIAPKFGKGPHRCYCFRVKAPEYTGTVPTISSAP